MEIKRKNKHYSHSKKIHVVELYKQGYGCDRISKMQLVNRTLVKRWICLYQNFGLSGFDKQANRELSVEIMEQVVRDVLSKTVALKYHISPSADYKWVQLVMQEGFSTIDQFESELNKYMYYYNNYRIKAKLKGLSPVMSRTQSY